MDLKLLLGRLGKFPDKQKACETLPSRSPDRYTTEELSDRLNTFEKLLPRLFSISIMRNAIAALENRLVALEDRSPADTLLKVNDTDSFVYTEFVQVANANGEKPFWIAVDKHADDPVVSYLREGVDWASMYLEPALRVVNPGITVLDLGAHVGTFSFACATRGARVLSVEPSIRSCTLLNASIAINGLKSVKVINTAVGSTTGSTWFVDVGPESMISQEKHAQLEATEVTLTTVDSLCHEHLGTHPDIIKMDVEGSEWEVFCGMEQTLERDPLIVFEVNGRKLNQFGRRMEEIFDLLWEKGFQIFLLTGDGLQQVTSSYFQIFNVCDYIAVRQLPTELDSEPRLDCPSVDEQAASIYNWARNNQSVDERFYLAQALQYASTDLINHSLIRETLLYLAKDPTSEVRDAIAWYKDKTSVGDATIS